MFYPLNNYLLRTNPHLLSGRTTWYPDFHCCQIIKRPAPVSPIFKPSNSGDHFPLLGKKKDSKKTNREKIIGKVHSLHLFKTNVYIKRQVFLYSRHQSRRR